MVQRARTRKGRVVGDHTQEQGGPFISSHPPPPPPPQQPAVVKLQVKHEWPAMHFKQLPILRLIQTQRPHPEDEIGSLAIGAA